MGSFGRKWQRAGAKREGTGPPVPEALQVPLAALRRSTLDATDLGVPWAYFHEELVSVPGFRDSGVAAHDPRLNQVLARVLGRLLPGAPPGRILSLRVGDFSHGLIETLPMPAVFFYFAAEDVGIVGSLGAGGSGELARFSVAELPGVGGSGPAVGS